MSPGNLLQQISNRLNPVVALINKPHNPSTLPPVPTPPISHLRTQKLIMVTAENNNKYYEMQENADGTFTVHYGRVGGTRSSATYPINRWQEKLREKTTKGYVDQTHLYATNTLAADASTITNVAVRTLMARLLELANQSIFQNYVVTAQQVTRQQIETAQQLLDELAGLLTTGLDTTLFNGRLLDLFKTIPRKMGKVSQHLVEQTPQTTDELQVLRDQLSSEQDTLDVIRGQVELTHIDTVPDQAPPTLLESLNLIVAPVADKRVLTLIKRMMGPDVDKFDAAFHVSHAFTQSAFDTYVARQNNTKTQLLWHGSRSENWLSILKSGLLLRPANAVITGKMFGYGIYFADQFSKSLNYTSLNGSVWTNGKQQEAYLAIYEVHVGKQLVVDQHQSWHMSLDESKLKAIDATYDSVYAQRGVSLQKNEFIVYKPDQCTVRYMVRIKA